MKIGDTFWITKPNRKYRITAIRKGFVHYKLDSLGAYPPRGMSHRTTIASAERLFRLDSPATGANVAPCG